MAKLNNHFCGLHLLVNLAEQCSTVLKEFEALQGCKNGGTAAVLYQGGENSKEAGAIRLIRTACKAFEKHGREKAGMQHAQLGLNQ